MSDGEAAAVPGTHASTTAPGIRRAVPRRVFGAGASVPPPAFPALLKDTGI